VIAASTIRSGYVLWRSSTGVGVKTRVHDAQRQSWTISIFFLRVPFRMIWRRARSAGIVTELGCHSFRASGITVYLMNGGLLEHAQQMAGHESARTTKLYDRRNDKVTLDEVERIVL